MEFNDLSNTTAPVNLKFQIYQSSNLLTLCFKSSFTMLKTWISELRKHGPVNIVLAIAGNKLDLGDLKEVDSKGKLIKYRF